MKTMKFIKASLIVLLIAGAFTACKKDKKPALPTKIEGKWAGKFGSSVNDLKEFNFTVKPVENGEGVLESTDPGNPGKVLTGTWKLTDGVFSGVLPYDGGNHYSFSASFDSKEGKLTLGTLTDSADPSVTKIFYLNKVK
ncbi:MAG: hypothetical protein WBP45_08740 [Daejeonella sp.]